MDNVTGVGGSPSVRALTEPTTSVSDTAAAFIALSHVDLPSGIQAGNQLWGTSSTPVITHITGEALILGNVTGYGVLIVDGPIDVTGNFHFYGLVIAGGDVEVGNSGNANIYGSLLLQESTGLDPPYEMDIRGNSTIQFDSCTLEPADDWVSLPKSAALLAWKENM